jgi:ABC-type multidrug transport system fused ATPase/permease subunit
MARGNFNVDDKDKKKVTREGLKKALKVFRYILPYKYTFAAGFFFLLVSGLTSMVFPFITGKLVDSAVGNLAGFDRNQMALALIGVLVVQGVFSFSRIQLFALVSENAMRDIRTSLYEKMVFLPVSFFEKRRVGELTSRLTSDISQLQDVLSFTLAELIRQITTLIIGVAVIIMISPRLTLVMISSFPFMILVAILFGKFIRKLSKNASDELAKANVVAEETLQAIHVVKAFTNEMFEVKRYGAALQNVVTQALKAARFRGVFISFVIFAIFGGIVLVLWYGLGLVSEGAMTIGDLVSFIIYTTFIGGAAGGLGDLYGQLQKTVGASERVMEILDNPETEQTPFSELPWKVAGAIEFKNLYFSYPTRKELTILSGINLSIAPGQKVALVGHSGAGKSTLVQLLMRYYQPDEGTVSIDGKTAQEVDVRLWRNNIAVVPQEVILFGGTIKENIAYGKPTATNEEVIEAARKANALEFIQSFPDGFNTIVGERGIKLSGGQRQRVAIARAILKDPAILVLDEATSSLDAASESLVQDALNTLMQNRTTIIIAHRLATVRQVDTIYVLKGGKIIEQGTHQQLLQNQDGLYTNLIRLQFDMAE